MPLYNLCLCTTIAVCAESADATLAYVERNGAHIRRNVDLFPADPEPIQPRADDTRLLFGPGEDYRTVAMMVRETAWRADDGKTRSVRALGCAGEGCRHERAVEGAQS